MVVNNVGPYNNPAETYEFYSLPFCAPREITAHKQDLGEVIAGDRRTTSLYDIRFGVDVEWQALCPAFELTQDEMKVFMDAIKRHYAFEFFVDDLPVRGFVGQVENRVHQLDGHLHNESEVFLFTHLDFNFAYNDDRVIAVNLTTDHSQRVKLEFDKTVKVEFSFSVKWTPSTTSYINRLTVHSPNIAGDHAIEIHWLSIINTFVLVILLTSFLAIILMRILKKDIAGYMDEEDAEAGDQEEEGGWKLLHADVFRPPEHVMLFSAAIGTGVQMLVLVVCILALSLFGTFYPGNRGALYTAAIVLYAMTAGVAGYVSSALYHALGGERWATNAVLTACLYALPFFCVFVFNNSVALSWGSTSAIPFFTIVGIILLWALVSFPLTIFGAMRGRQSGLAFDAPTKTNRAAREIPASPFFRSPIVQMFLAGFLPFSAIYIELHYIFASVWGHHAYTLFGILTLAFIMLLVVTAFITVALTYFQLAIEDWRWWWRSFFSGGATGMFIYLYGVFFFAYRSEMTGLLQTCFFFGYMFMVSYAFVLMLGAIGWFTASRFVWHIYASIKVN